MASSQNLQPKLLLFLSADLIDSSDLKSSIRSEEDWVPKFGAFYTYLLALVQREFPKTSSFGLILWKSLGDEMIFVAPIVKTKDVKEIIVRFRTAIREFNAQFEKKPSKLKLKSTAWTAGFPVGNAEILIPNFGSDGSAVDYIGPCMDIGFRLGKHADARRFVISVELAMLLTNWSCSLSIFCDRLITLKGILRGEPYPFIWLDMLNDGERQSIDALRGEAPKIDKIKDFCHEFLNKHRDQLIIPFVADDQDFGEKPSDWESRYKIACLAQTQERIEYSEEHSKEAPKASPPTMNEALEKLRAAVRSAAASKPPEQG